VLSDFDYLRDQTTAVAFERRAAAKAREIAAVRPVVAVPQIWRITASEISAAAVSTYSLSEGEQEAITWMACDLDDGVDYGRVTYTRRPNGERFPAEHHHRIRHSNFIELAAFAFEAGGQDNITVVLARFPRPPTAVRTRLSG